MPIVCVKQWIRLSTLPAPRVRQHNTQCRLCPARELLDYSSIALPSLSPAAAAVWRAASPTGPCSNEGRRVGTPRILGWLGGVLPTAAHVRCRLPGEALR